MKRIFAILVILLSLCSLVDGEQWRKTFIKTGFGGNGTAGEMKYTSKWLAQRMWYMIAGNADFPGLMDTLRDSCAAHGVPFYYGPYASSQEWNLLQRGAPETSYEARRADYDNCWLYNYAADYMDSIGVSTESLVVHLSDASIDITQDGDGNRSYSLSSLIYPRTRFTYQYWNNTVSDTFYPAGYVWLANGKNPDTRNAGAYAYRRRMIEDSADWVGMGGHMPTAYFMDNQYRDQSRLGSYYDINSSSGGATSGMDWVEQAGIQSSVDSGYVYFDSSTMLLDERIDDVLDSTCDALGLSRIMQIANITKSNITHLAKTYPHVDAVSLENVAGYTENVSNWRVWYQYADTMSKHPDHYIFWGTPVDNIYGTSGWRSDSDRVWQGMLCFYLTVQDTNAFGNFMRFNDTTRWRKSAEVNFGTPDSLAKFIDSMGNRDYVRDVGDYPNDSTKIYAVRRYYDDSNVVIIFITSTSGRWGTHTLDNISESLTVNLGNSYYEINADAETSQTTVSSVRLPLYSGFIGTRNFEPTEPTIGVAPSSFTFNAIYGGADPANQSLSITNEGGGTLNWEITKILGASWLTLGQTTGEGDGSCTLDPSISGLEIGDYSDTLNVAATGATNTPQKVPVTLNVVEVGANTLKKPWGIKH